ncbi:hypothetical protein L9F63_022684, partial [Diploptera punctata]
FPRKRIIISVCSQYSLSNGHILNKTLIKKSYDTLYAHISAPSMSNRTLPSVHFTALHIQTN